MNLKTQSGGEKPLVADIAFPLPLRKLWSYKIPEELKDKIVEGCVVLCPFQNKKYYGIVFKVTHREEGEIKLKSVDSLLFEGAVFEKEVLKFFEFLSDYYLAGIGEVLSTALPAEVLKRVREKIEEIYFLRKQPEKEFKSKKAGKIIEILKNKEEVSKEEIKNSVSNPSQILKKLLEKGYISVKEKILFRDPYNDILEREGEKLKLTNYQEQAYKKIKNELYGGFKTFFLHGVTGSGKTEVYLRLVEDVLEKGKSAIILVPEIALTPQLARILKERFGQKIVVFHSGLTEGERFDAWMRCKNGFARIVVGARSAIFTPLKNLGLIVVDEEHDASYKQGEKNFRYNGRDIAIMRGKFSSCPVILSSATPSLESYGNIKKGKFHYISLPERIEKREMPEIEIIDMRFEKAVDGERLFSSKLLLAIEETLKRDEQVILFLNRRGFSAFMLCRKCGFVPQCPNCSISLTYHKSINLMVCHYCDFKTPLRKFCHFCGDEDVSLLGFGTEKIEEKLKKIFPYVKTQRLDRDTTRGKGMRKILESFRKKEISILVGTQILAKGHDFPDVTLVGVIIAEIGLKFPDFRAAERTFQLLTQVAGRAGRGEKPGKVFIQTYDPQHYALKYVIGHNYHGFIEKEDSFRYERGYPPYTYLVLIEIFGKNQEKTIAMVERCRKTLFSIIKEEVSKRQIILLGPCLAPYQKLKGKYRWMMLLKSKQRPLLLNHMKEFSLQMKIEKLSDPKVIIDVDPIDLL